jgi:hypothetical protein
MRGIWLLSLVLLLVGCAARPIHLRVPLLTGEVLPVTLHQPDAWECTPIIKGAVTCTNITDQPQDATVGHDRITVPPHTHMTIEERRGGVWL